MSPRTDVCPSCGGRRVELVVAPGRFYCLLSNGEHTGAGPNVAPPAPRAGEQLTLGAT